MWLLVVGRQLASTESQTLRSTQYVTLILFGLTLLIASESDKTELRVVVFGKTGVGKSSLANTLLDTDVFQTGVGSRSVTHTSQRFSRIGYSAFGAVKLSIVDTPGLFDTRYGNEKTAYVIGSCVKLSLPGPHVFILVASVAQRFTDEDIQTVKTLNKQFGESISEYLMIVFNSKDRLGNTTPSEYIKDATLPLRKTLAQCSNRYAFIDTEDHTSQKQADVADIMKMVGNIIKKNKGHYYTNQMYEEAARKRDDAERRRDKEHEERQRSILSVGLKTAAAAVVYWFYGWVPAVATAALGALV